MIMGEDGEIYRGFTQDKVCQTSDTAALPISEAT